MVKRILIVLLVILLLGAIGFGVYWFFLKPKPLLGSVENAHSVRLNIADNVYYDVLVPNEAVLLETDEATVYRFDLLTVGIQDVEPTSTAYKVKVEGRWVYVESKDLWLKPSAYSMEVNAPYSLHPVYEYLWTTNEEGEQVPAIWNDGPAPEFRESQYEPGIGAHIYAQNDYIIYGEEYGRWADVVEHMLTKLCALSRDYVPHYYEDGLRMYAYCNGYTVGVVYGNFNTQYTVVAKGQVGTNEALAILTADWEVEENVG